MLALATALSTGAALAQDGPSGTLTIGWQWDPSTYVEGFTGSSAGQMFDLHTITLNR